LNTTKNIQVLLPLQKPKYSDCSSELCLSTR